MNTSSLNLEAFIQVSNLHLEPILPKHAPLLFASLQAADLYSYIPFLPPKSIEDLEARYRRWAVRHSPNGEELWLNYAIRASTVLGCASDEYVGTLQATIEAIGKTYIAYEVFPPYWRCGIASKAVSALVSYLFESCEVDVISAHVDTRNEASFGLLESLGFKRIETLKDADYFKGSSSDEYVYELQKLDWRA